MCIAVNAGGSVADLLVHGHVAGRQRAAELGPGQLHIMRTRGILEPEKGILSAAKRIIINLLERLIIKQAAIQKLSW